MRITAVRQFNPPDWAPEAGPGFDIVLDGVVSGDTFSGSVDRDGQAPTPYAGVGATRPNSRGTDGAVHGQ